MLGYVLVRTTDHDLETKKRMLGYVHLEHNAIFYFMTVTTVMSVTSVILMRIYCFSIYYKSVMSVV